ncbi:hypothetical protein [Hymenobacter sp. IS2118]|uniref:hypothetical protein n=1 Tax=Hymenobacter sp. IS2118 TaxID=1505605 RepID=UPI000550D060|nr:hypothetical protein [Hymenobacter sp. IS2118]
METFLLFNRYLHITAGFIGFFMAPAALFVRKGGPWHRRWGQVFFWAMAVAGVTAIVAASFKGLTFLLLTGVFSLYLAGFGYRSLYLKQLARGGSAPLFDWIVASLGFGIFLLTLVYGVVARNVPAGVFGVIGLLMTSRQLRGYRRAGSWSRTQWLHNHISGFLGAYIAAVSAFSATSLTFIPFPYNFLWPSVIGIPLTMWWQRRVRRQLAVAPTGTEALEVRIQPEPA